MRCFYSLCALGLRSFPLPFARGEAKQRQHTRERHSDGAVRLATLFQIELMIFFGAPEFRSRLDLRDDRAIEFSTSRNLLLRRFGRGFLFRRMIKDHRAILRPHIGTLSIQRSRIVIRPKNIKKLIVMDLRRVEFQLDGLGVAGLIAANIFVARIVFVSTRIPDGRRCDAFQFAEGFFHAPKTTRPERRFLCRHAK